MGMVYNVLFYVSINYYLKRKGRINMEKFEFWQSKKDGQWYFHLIAPNGEVVAQSQGYSTKDNCINGIKAIKLYSQNAVIFEDEK